VTDLSLADQMYDLAKRLFPMGRSLTGQGVRETLGIIKEYLPDLNIHEVPTGTPCFDWTVPDEWNIRDAYVLDPRGKKIIDYQCSNLHVVGYSEPQDKILSLEALQPHLHSLPDLPDAIPYVTSYYHRTWGFCLPHTQRSQLEQGDYRVVIDSDLGPGSMTFAEWILPGRSNKEVLFSTNICHPSMANNELSGPVVVTHLARWLMQLKERHHTYRILFLPETIGSIYYLSQHLQHLQEHVISGFVVSCVGDDRCYSLIPSSSGDTLADRIARHVLKHHTPTYNHYTFLNRGSDERQYCNARIELPIVCMLRSAYGKYPEYHTSLDNLDLISPEGLYGSYQAFQRAILCLEHNETLRNTVLCEPQLGKRGLYPTLYTRNKGAYIQNMRHILVYANGKKDLLTIAELIGQPMWELLDIVSDLKHQGLLEVVPDPLRRHEPLQPARI